MASLSSWVGASNDVDRGWRDARAGRGCSSGGGGCKRELGSLEEELFECCSLSIQMHEASSAMCDDRLCLLSFCRSGVDWWR